MTENYSEKPRKTWLEVLHEMPGGAAVAHFCENIEEYRDEDGNTAYRADHYALETSYRVGLKETIESNREIWLEAAKKRETQEENKTLKARVEELETTVADQDEAINELIIAQLG